MANTHIVFTKIRNGFGLDAMSFVSQTLANNAVSANSNSSYNVVSVTAIGGPAWVAVADATGVANAANANTRIYIGSGQSRELGVRGSVKIHTLDA